MASDRGQARSASAAGVTFQLAQLILGSLQLGPERPNFILQPLNVGGTALIGGRQLAIVLQRGELVSKLVAKQHSPFGAGEVDALFEFGLLCSA